MLRVSDVSAVAAVRSRYLGLYAAATAAQHDSGRRWYLRARADCAAIARANGYAVLDVVRACAALSSNVGWDRNLELTAALAAAPGDNPGTFGKCHTAALDCLLDGAAVTGPKRAPFAAAIWGDTSAAVIDRHMFRAAGFVAKSTPRRLRVCARALRETAAVLGLSVTTLQATVWLIQKERD